jgi:hypothetical protein
VPNSRAPRTAGHHRPAKGATRVRPVKRNAAEAAANNKGKKENANESTPSLQDALGKPAGGGREDSEPNRQLFGMHVRASPDSTWATTASGIGLISLMILASMKTAQMTATNLGQARRDAQVP